MGDDDDESDSDSSDDDEDDEMDSQQTENRKKNGKVSGPSVKDSSMKLWDFSPRPPADTIATTAAAVAPIPESELSILETVGDPAAFAVDYGLPDTSHVDGESVPVPAAASPTRYQSVSTGASTPLEWDLDLGECLLSGAPLKGCSCKSAD